MYQKILIPLDGSELAECSLSHAGAIAKGCNASDLIVFPSDTGLDDFSIRLQSFLA